MENRLNHEEVKEFYKPIANHLYSELTLRGLNPRKNFHGMWVNDNHFDDPFDFIEAKHKHAEFKGKTFYLNVIKAIKENKPEYSEIWDLDRYYDDFWNSEKGNLKFSLGLEEIESKIVDYCKNKIYELENGIDGNDKEFKKKDLAERLLIIYFLREENLFPKFTGTNLETDKGHNEFLGILLSENEDTIKKRFSESVNKITLKKEIVSGNKRLRIEQLENVKKYFQKINHQGIIVKIEQLITDTRNHS